MVMQLIYNNQQHSLNPLLPSEPQLQHEYNSTAGQTNYQQHPNPKQIMCREYLQFHHGI